MTVNFASTRGTRWEFAHTRSAISLIAFVAVSWMLFGLEATIGGTILVCIHEMGHFLEAKRRGFEPAYPVFLPALGAYVKLSRETMTPDSRAAVALAGPTAGFIGTALCALGWVVTHSPSWAAFTVFGSLINVLNLIPYWTLDGAHIAPVLGKFYWLAVAIESLTFFFLTERWMFLALGCIAFLWLFVSAAPLKSNTSVGISLIALIAAFGTLLRMLPSGPFWVRSVSADTALGAVAITVFGLVMVFLPERFFPRKLRARPGRHDSTS